LFLLYNEAGKAIEHLAKAYSIALAIEDYETARSIAEQLSTTALRGLLAHQLADLAEQLLESPPLFQDNMEQVDPDSNQQSPMIPQDSEENFKQESEFQGFPASTYTI
jgi:hypothetical protein